MIARRGLSLAMLAAPLVAHAGVLMPIKVGIEPHWRFTYDMGERGFGILAVERRWIDVPDFRGYAFFPRWELLSPPDTFGLLMRDATLHRLDGREVGRMPDPVVVHRLARLA